MPERLPSLNALRAFEAVARHLSFSKAAEELHVSQAAVSQQIKALEAGLGAPLLRRAKRRGFLTDTGQSGLADLRESFDLMARAVALMRTDIRRQQLTIRVEPTFAATWLVGRLDSFRDTNDGIDILIDASLDLPEFGREGIDIAIHFGTGDYPGQNVRQLFRDVVFPVCSPDLLDGSHPLREPKDLRHHTLLHIQSIPGYGEWPYWRAWLRAMGVRDIDVSGGMRFTEHSMALQAAVAGEGVALGTTAIVSDDVASGRLVMPFQEHLETKFGYYLVWPRNAARRPDVSAFCDWICAAVGEPQGR